MIQVQEFKEPIRVGFEYQIFNISGEHIATVYNRYDAKLISEVPNMVMMLQKVLKDYELILDRPNDSHIYIDIHKVLSDAKHWRGDVL